MASSFSYYELNDSDIRLLHMTGYNAFFETTAYLRHFPLATAPAYKALSYCWGDESPTEALVCNEQCLSIRPNLSEAIKQIHNSLQPMWIWIDAICINQNDIDERARVVRRMPQIYRNAVRVVIWLSPEDDYSDLVMDMIPVLRPTWEAGGKSKESEL
jgi:hypothetical protein